MGLRRRTVRDLLERKCRYLVMGAFRNVRWKRKFWMEQSPLTPRGDRSGKNVLGEAAVRTGLLCNFALAVLKFGIWQYTGSKAIFADLMHSAADVTNYGYRLYTLRDSASRSRDGRHPYGYGRMAHICADRSFLALLSLGGVLPFVEACATLHQAHEAVETISRSAAGLSIAMFSVSGAIEFYAARAGYQ